MFSFFPTNNIFLVKNLTQADLLYNVLLGNFLWVNMQQKIVSSQKVGFNIIVDSFLTEKEKEKYINVQM